MPSDKPFNFVKKIRSFFLIRFTTCKCFRIWVTEAESQTKAIKLVELKKKKMMQYLEATLKIFKYSDA